MPLDHTGAVPGRLSLRIQRLRSRIQPGARRGVRARRRPGAVRHRGVRRRRRRACSTPRTAAATRSCSTSAAPACSGALRCRSLEEANLLDATDGGRALRRRARPAARLLHHGRHGGGHGGDPARARRRADRHLRDLLRHEGRARLCAPLSGARGAAGARLGGRRRTARTRSTATPSPRCRAPCSALCRSACRSFTRDPDGRSRARWSARLRAASHARPPRGRAGPRPAREPDADRTCSACCSPGTSTPRCAPPSPAPSARRWPATPRRILRLRRRAFRVDGEPPPPRVLSAALYATTSARRPRCRGRGPARPTRRCACARRPVVVGALPASVFAPFDRGTVLRTDLLALCAGWPAARAGARAGTGGRCRTCRC